MMRGTEKAGPFERSIVLFSFACLLQTGVNVSFNLFSFAVPLGARMLLSAVTVGFSLGVATFLRRRIKPKPATSHSILVRWGQTLSSGATWGFFFYTASALLGFFTLIMVYISTPSIPSQPEPFNVFSSFLSSALPLVRWVIIFLSGMVTLVATIGAHSTYCDIEQRQTKHAEPVLYDTLRAAREGYLVLGHEFSRVAESYVPDPTAALTTTTGVEGPEGVIVHRTVEKVTGENGPYILDLLKEVNPHIICTGSPGAGKTEFLRVLICRCWLAWKTPSLCIDWIGELAPFIRSIGGMVWTFPTEFKINPLRLGGASPARRADEIIEALRFGTDPPITAFQGGELKRIILRAYAEAGIREEDPSTWNRPPPTWGDLIRILEENVKAGHYEGTLKESVISTREKLYIIEPITGHEPTEFFDIVMRIPTCLDLSPLATADDKKAVATYTVYQRIYQRFFTAGLVTAELARRTPQLRMIVVVDEAHFVLSQKAAESAVGRLDPLPLRVIRLGRKYGFSTVFASQSITDIPEIAAESAAVFVAFLHSTPGQLRYVQRQLKLSKPEVEMYSRMPRGACFIRRLRQPYADIVKIQMLSDLEMEAAYQLSKSVKLPQVLPPQPEIQPVTRPETRETPAETEREEQAEVTEPIEIETAGEVHCSNCGSELTLESKFCSRCGNPVIQTPKPETPTAEDLEGLTLTEKRLLHSLSFGPMTFRDLNTKFRDVKERQLRNLLAGLEGTFIHSAKVPTLVEGKNDVYYAALTAKELRRESLEHRALALQLQEALLPLGATVFTQNQRQGGNVPDIGLPLTKPAGACIEVETGRKKQSLARMLEWARAVKQRNNELGYPRTVVVVPNVTVERRYKEICVKHNLELVTMANLAEHLNIELVTKAEPPTTVKPSARPDEEKEESKQERPAEVEARPEEQTLDEGDAEAKLRKLLQHRNAEEHSSA